MVEKRVFLRGVFINYGQLLVAFVLNFALTPLMLKYLGQAGYGVWAAFSSIMTYFVLLDFGLNTAVAKYTAEYRAVERQDKISAMASTAIIIFGAIALLVLLASFTLACFIDGIFEIPTDLVSPAKTAFVVMSANVALMILASVFGNILYGFQRVDIWKASSIIQLLTNALLVILFLKFGFGLVGLAAASMVSSVLLVYLYLYFIRRGKYGLIFTHRLASMNTLKEIAPFSIRTFVLGVTSRMLYYTGPILVGIILGVSAVTPYDITFKLCFYTTYLFSIISTSMLPKFAEAYALKDIKTLSEIYLKTVKITFALAVFVAALLLSWGEAFINLWVGPAGFAGFPVLLLLVAMNIFHALGTPAIALLQGIGKNKWVTYSEMWNAVLNLALSIALLNNIGLPGIVLAMIVSHIFTSFWVMHGSVLKYAQLKIRDYLLSALLPAVLAGVVSFGLIFPFRKAFLDIGGFQDLFLKGGFMSILFGCAYYAVALNREEKRSVIGLFKG